MLMVTTTMRMLNRVHSNTSNSWPVVSLSLSFEPRVGGLQERLIGSLSTSDNTDHASAATKEGLADAGRESDSGLLAVFGVTDDDGGGAGGTGEAATITELGLDVGDNGALWHHINGEDVADGERGFCAAVDELAGVEALHGDPLLLRELVAVRVVEDDLAHRGAAARVVDDVLDEPLHVALALGEVHGAELHGALPQPGLRGEDQGLALTGSADDATHGC